MTGGGGGAGDAIGFGGGGSFGPAAYEVWAEGMARYLAMVAAQFGRARAKETPYVDREILGKCIQERFGATLLEFNESQPGSNGSFAGYGADTFSNEGNDANIYIINDVTSYDSAGLRRLSAQHGRPVPPTVFVTGLTLPINPYRNYTASNCPGAIRMAKTQVHELGNSLQLITGAAFNPATVRKRDDRDPGQWLQECLEDRGGFRQR